MRQILPLEKILRKISENNVKLVLYSIVVLLFHVTDIISHKMSVDVHIYIWFCMLQVSVSDGETKRQSHQLLDQNR